MAALWVVFTPPQPVPPTTPANYPTLPHPPAAHVALWSQSKSLLVSSCVYPKHWCARLMEEHSSETIDLRVPEALLEHLYGAGRAVRAGEEPSPVR